MVALILSGGANTRIPLVKGLIEIDGETIIGRTLRVLGGLFEKVYISTNRPETYYRFGAPMIGDVVKGAGPMAGIFSAFLATSAREMFVTACDMPFIMPEVVRYITSNRSGAATAPVFGGRPEPLLAVYTEAVLGRMEEMLMGGTFGMTRFLNEVDAGFIDEAALAGIDESGRSFVNINTLEDLSEASGGRKCSV